MWQAWPSCRRGVGWWPSRCGYVAALPSSRAPMDRMERSQSSVILQLRLSRFNPRVPGREAPLGVVQGTAQFHHQIADVLLPQADPVCDEATALHMAVDMRDPSPATVPCLGGQCLL